MLYNGSYIVQGSSPPYAIYSTGTWNKGIAPCSLQVSSASGGSFSVVDSKNSVLYLSSSVPQPASVDTLLAGQSLAQGTQLFSANGLYFLVVQSNGNLALCASAFCCFPDDFVLAVSRRQKK